MDPQRLKSAYERLQLLDDRLSYRLRPQAGGMMRPSADQLDERIRHLAEFSLELKEVLHEVILAFARTKPAAAAPSPPAGPAGAPERGSE
jgi:hypothetical protein